MTDLNDVEVFKEGFSIQYHLIADGLIQFNIVLIILLIIISYIFVYLTEQTDCVKRLIDYIKRNEKLF